MDYVIIGTIGYTMGEDQIDRLCAKLGVEHVGTLVDQDVDNHPTHFIDVESSTFLVEERVKEVFGEQFKLKFTSTYGEKKMDTEQMIQEEGATMAPRVTLAHVEAKIAQVDYHRLTDVLTVCVITTQNGFTVTGESACASPENYNEKIGQKIAYDEAFGKLYGLEGYLLKEQLYHTKMLQNHEDFGSNKQSE